MTLTVESPRTSGDVARLDALRCEGLVKSYGDVRAVDGVSLRVRTGECLGLLGPNGAGKSTTIGIICGLTSSDGGTVAIDGQQLGRRNHALASVGYMPQHVALYLDLTARENLEFFARVRGAPKRAAAAAASAGLDVAGLADRADDRVGTLSAGMQRRLSLSVALLGEPRLLVLDEPGAGVDPQSRLDLLETLGALRDRGTAIIYTTHHFDEAERLCDRVAIMDRGRVLAEGSVPELVDEFAGRGSVVMRVAKDASQLAGACRRIKGVLGAVAEGDDLLDLVTDGESQTVARVLAAAERRSISVLSVDLRDANLESVFFNLTGRALRD